MKYEEWLEQFEFHDTEKGTRFDLRFYVYPDGHGNIQCRTKAERMQEDNQPVNNVEEALEKITDLWKIAMNSG